MAQARLTNRTIWIQRVIILAAIVLIFQTGWLQLVDPTYGQKADKTTLVRRTLYPARGLILDRTGHLMVHNIPVYDLKVINNHVPKDIDTALLCQVLEIDKASYRERIEKDRKSLRYYNSIPYDFIEQIPDTKIQ